MAVMRDTGGVVDAEQSTMQVVMDQLEELVVTIIEEIRERPGVAAAIFAAIVGVVLGSILAAAVSRRPSPRRRVAKTASKFSDFAELARVGMGLLENPIVRGVVVAQLRRRLMR